MITWKRVGEHTPTNVNKRHFNSIETPFVTCIVWVCNPDIIAGGLPDVVRWDTKNKCWLESDKQNKWFHEPPYQITHFFDEYNIPDENEESPIYLASNEPPPPMFIYGDGNQSLPGSVARKYLNELTSWENIRFTFCIPVNGVVAEFIPLLEKDAGKKITDYKYIFKI